MDELLMGKFENPMKGLVAAHLLLLDAQPRLDLVAHVVGNTGGLVGADHPDVLALRLRVDQLRGQPAAGLAALRGGAPAADASAVLGLPDGRRVAGGRWQ